MANPRKFSEKIALHTHRQAEETAAFEKIMKEVSDVKPDEPVQSRMVNPVLPRQSRTRSPGGPIRSTRERKASPYSSVHYLSPPSDTGWRRTNSDSALHQSAMQGMGMERNEAAPRVPWGGMLPTMNGPDSRNLDGRPRSSCDISRVPGINVYPSPHDGMQQIPIGNNTGSLPDLTNVDFTSPIHVPLDQDADNSSPYSSNHLSVPSNSRYSRFHQRSLSQSDKNIGLDNTDFSQLGAMTGIYQQPGSPSSPVQLPQMDGGYRSPRPSPQPSPTLAGRHSAPCSPGEPSPLNHDYHMHNQNMQFQQHFEQLTVSDSPISQMSYVDQSGTSTQMSQTHPQNMQSDVSTDCYSTSPSQQLGFPSPSPGVQNTSPNTPTSVPEIILQDFSEVQDINRQLDSEFFADALSRDDLGALEFADLQMLNNMGGIREIIEDYNSYEKSMKITTQRDSSPT